MITHPQRSSVGGFTLVEVMMAAAMMLAGIVGMIQVVTSASEMLDASRKQTIATEIMRAEIEKIRVTDWSQIPLAVANGYATRNGIKASDLPSAQREAALVNGSATVDGGRMVQWLSGGATAPADSAFKCQRSVTMASGRTDMKQITYTVTWTGNTGRSYTRTSSTYVGKNGLNVAYQR